MTNNAERDAFEKWARKTYSVERHCGLRDQYAAVGVECAWQAWQARAQASSVPDEEMERCERLLTDCQCLPDYKDRDMTDPYCIACQLGNEVIDTFRVMRSVLHQAPTPPKSASVPVERLEALYYECMGEGEVCYVHKLSDLIAEYKP